MSSPIFIIGLHRSGTTFLYESLVKAFPLTPLTLFDIINFDNMYAFRKSGDEELKRQELNDQILALGIKDRGMDTIKVSDKTVDEYGWLLKYKSGEFKSSDKNIHFLKNIILILSELGIEGEKILLKSPWDTGQVSFLFENFPDAKFIFIKRPPEQILRSQLNNSIQFATSPQPFLEMLLKPIPNGNYYLTMHRWGKQLLGRKGFSYIMRKILKKTIFRERKAYQRSYEALPKSQKFEIFYEHLIRDPETILNEISKFIEIPPRSSSSKATTNPSPSEKFANN